MNKLSDQDLRKLFTQGEGPHHLTSESEWDAAVRKAERAIRRVWWLMAGSIAVTLVGCSYAIHYMWVH